jgi:hypothetical protein
VRERAPLSQVLLAPLTRGLGGQGRVHPRDPRRTAKALQPQPGRGGRTAARLSPHRLRLALLPARPCTCASQQQVQLTAASANPWQAEAEICVGPPRLASLQHTPGVSPSSRRPRSLDALSMNLGDAEASPSTRAERSGVRPGQLVRHARLTQHAQASACAHAAARCADAKVILHANRCTRWIAACSMQQQAPSFPPNRILRNPAPAAPRWRRP